MSKADLEAVLDLLTNHPDRLSAAKRGELAEQVEAAISKCRQDYLKVDPYANTWADTVWEETALRHFDREIFNEIYALL